MSAKFDALLLEVARNEFAAIPEEIALAIARTGRSMQVKIGDCATILSDERGRCIAEGAAPFQTVSLTLALEHAIRRFSGSFQPGDVIVVNDPYSGMTHMPDCGVIVPIFWRDQLVGFTPTYSHHTDMGGRFPGSFTSAAASSYEEGLRLPPVKLYSAGQRNEAVVDVIRANVRNPEDWFGDLEAKIAGCRIGGEHVRQLLDKYGVEGYRAISDYLQDYAEQKTRVALREIPDGEYVSEDVFEDDGLGGKDVKMPLRLALKSRNDELIVDLTGSADQAPGGVNVPYGMTSGFILGALRTVFGADVILNSGFMRPIKIVAPEGSAFNPRFPAAVAGRAPLAHRLQEMTYRCLAQALPEKVGVAGGSGDLIHFSGKTVDGRYFAFMDIFTSGWGARPGKDGIESVASLTFRGGATPLELLEREFPIVVEAYGNAPDTEGAGKYRGALGSFREWRFLAPGRVLIRADHLVQPWQGAAGGLAGAKARTVFESGGVKKTLPPLAHQTIDVQPGDRLSHLVGGAGGYGDPFERDPARVLADVSEGKVSIAGAAERYGVAVNADLSVDRERTAKLRGARNVSRGAA